MILTSSNKIKFEIDTKDFKKVSCHTWYVRTVGPQKYVTARFNNTTLYLHRLIMRPATRKHEVDHIDGNGLNNKRANLRICTTQQNNLNRTKKRKGTTSRYKGVYFTSEPKRIKRWTVEITRSGRAFCFGRFHTEIEAAIIYDVAAVELHGEYAATNFDKDYYK